MVKRTAPELLNVNNLQFNYSSSLIEGQCTTYQRGPFDRHSNLNFLEIAAIVFTFFSCSVLPAHFVSVSFFL